ncbi:MAG: 50S ribosomal protein L11 methyltransferase, partial [Clostridiales bacterium]|nr:50S ribosomal protein L11 methyltransferase [Clostridiales bacterium]
SNIVADVIIGLTGYVPRLLAGKGLFIASGIIDERYEETREAIVRSGFVIKNALERDGWHCIVGERA